MASTLITNIRLLVNTRKQNQLLKGKQLAELPCIENAWLQVEDGIIVRYGAMEELKSFHHQLSSVMDSGGATILPAGAILIPFGFCCKPRGRIC
jgi:imidazolonepropionase